MWAFLCFYLSNLTITRNLLHTEMSVGHIQESFGQLATRGRYAAGSEALPPFK